MQANAAEALTGFYAATFGLQLRADSVRSYRVKEKTTYFVRALGRGFLRGPFHCVPILMCSPYACPPPFGKNLKVRNTTIQVENDFPCHSRIISLGFVDLSA